VSVLESLLTYFVMLVVVFGLDLPLGLAYWLIRFRRFFTKVNAYRATGLNPYRIPLALWDLIPLADQWGIEDDRKRSALQQQATPAEKRAER